MYADYYKHVELCRERRRKRRRLEHDRRGGCCENCGSIVDLSFHHRIPCLKMFNFRGLFSRSIGTINKELVMCDLFCRWCHEKADGKIDKKGVYHCRPGMEFI